jgi:hypothetical protein
MLLPCQKVRNLNPDEPPGIVLRSNASYYERRLKITMTLLQRAVLAMMQQPFHQNEEIRIP